MIDRTITLLAKADRKALIRIERGSDAAYTQERITDDAKRLADTLQAALPMTTFMLLARMMEARAWAIEQGLEQKAERL